MQQNSTSIRAAGVSSKQRCPKCGFSNDPTAVRCANCQAPLVTICPRCGTARRWYVPTCPNCAAQTEDDQEFARLFRDPPKGQLNKRYTIVEVLNQGSLTALYRCQDNKASGAAVLVKEFQATALFRAQERRAIEQAFWTQVKAWQLITHPALTPILDAFTESDRFYVVMPYLTGLSWRVLIVDERWRATPHLAANWALQLCQLLSFLEQQPEPRHLPFLAPQHIMVTLNGQVQVLDYGLTALFAPGKYAPYGSVSGYAAPELAQQPPSAASDIYSLGRLLYALLTGQQLDQGGRTNIPLRQVVPGISEGFARTIAHAAQRDLAKRISSTQALYEALVQSGTSDSTPIADWIAQAMRAEHLAAPQRVEHRTRQRTAGESMTDLGFAPDPRFGAQAALKDGKTPREQANIPPAARLAASQPSEPMLSVVPRAIQITDNTSSSPKRVVLTLHNRGEGTLEGRIRSNSPFVHAPARQFQLKGGQTARAIITVEANKIPSGKHNEAQAVAVETSAGRTWIALSSDIASAPVLRLSQPILDYGIVTDDAPRNLPLVIENGGDNVLNGRVSATVPWLNVNKPGFLCQANAAVSVIIGFTPEKIPNGRQEDAGALVIDSDGGQAHITVRAWRQRAEYDLAANTLDMGSTVNGILLERVFKLGNKGDGVLEGSARSLAPYLAVQPRQFTIEPKSTCEFTVTVDCRGMNAGRLETSEALRLQSNAGTRTLGLRLEILAPRLKLADDAVDFGQVSPGSLVTRLLAVSNEGSALLIARVTTSLEWLQVSPMQFELQPGASQALTISAATSQFVRGGSFSLSDGLRIVDDSGAVTNVAVKINIIQPALSLDLEQLDFGYLAPGQSVSRQLTLSNSGNGKLAWQAVSSAIWVEITPAKGICPAGETQVITLTAYSLAFDQDASTVTGSLVINSDGGRAKVELRAGTARPVLATDTTLLELSSVNDAPGSGSLRVFNYGLGDLSGSISSAQTWLVPDRVSFVCPTGRSIEVGVHTDPAELPPAAVHASGILQIDSNGGTADIDVELSVTLRPELKPPVDKLEFKLGEDGTYTAKFTLHNIGKAIAHTEITASGALQLNRSVLEIKPGKSVPVQVTWLNSEPPGKDEALLTITCSDQLFHISS
ncbi:MAG: Ig-like domain-containing protein [Anaerolineae bacterium]